MAISRRSFLRGSGLAAASSLVAPSLFANPFVRQAFADTIGDRYLLSIYLDGGNDGFNTVIPVDNGGSDIPGVCLRSEIAGEMRQNATSVLAARRLRSLRFPYDDDFDDDAALKRAAFVGLYEGAAATALPIAEYVGTSGVATLLATESYACL